MAMHNATPESAWTRAVATYAHLRNHGRLTAVEVPIPGLLPAPGEYAVAMITGGMTFERYLPGQLSDARSGSALVMGSPRFVAGFALTTALLRAGHRHRAQRQAVPQWWPTPVRRVVVTTKRLWCEIITSTGPTWFNFNYDAITGLQLEGAALTVSFLQSEPLRLTGAWTAWCAAVIAHLRFGAHAPAVVPSLHAAASHYRGPAGPDRRVWNAATAAPRYGSARAA